MPLDVTRRTEGDVLLAEGGDLGHARARVVHRQQQGIVASSAPVRPIQAREHGVHLLTRHIVAHLGIGPLHRNGGDTGGEADRGRLAQRNHAEEGPNRGEA